MSKRAYIRRYAATLGATGKRRAEMAKRNLAHCRDQAVSYALRLAVHHKIIKGYGEMLNLRIDSDRKSFDAEVLLKGESAPISIRVERYEFSAADDKCYLKLEGLSASREWLTLLMRRMAEDLLEDSRLEITDKRVVSALKAVL